MSPLRHPRTASSTRNFTRTKAGFASAVTTRSICSTVPEKIAPADVFNCWRETLAEGRVWADRESGASRGIIRAFSSRIYRPNFTSYLGSRTDSRNRRPNGQGNPSLLYRFFCQLESQKGNYCTSLAVCFVLPFVAPTAERCAPPSSSSPDRKPQKISVTEIANGP